MRSYSVAASPAREVARHLDDQLGGELRVGVDGGLAGGVRFARVEDHRGDRRRVARELVAAAAAGAAPRVAGHFGVAPGGDERDRAQVDQRAAQRRRPGGPSTRCSPASSRSVPTFICL